MQNTEWKIFEIRSAESEYICARTNIEALQYLFSMTGIFLSEFSNDDEVIEIPKEKWIERFVIMDIDGTEEEQEASKISFAQWIEKHDGKHPDYIASTVF